MKRIHLILIACLLWLPAANSAELPANIIVLDGSVADNFTITDYDNKTYELKQSRGRWVFLHFWASWCGPCRREMPIVDALKKQLADKPIDIIIVNTAEDEDTIFSFLGSVAPDAHSYMDREGELTEKWAPRGLPTTFFIDPQGRKRYLALGGRPWETAEYQKFLQSLFQSK
jgi:thiol-disulfide isomerase/thioredoxin